VANEGDRNVEEIGSVENVRPLEERYNAKPKLWALVIVSIKSKTHGRQSDLSGKTVREVWLRQVL